MKTIRTNTRSDAGGAGDPTLEWPPRSASESDPVVLDLRRNVLLSIDDAAAGRDGAVGPPPGMAHTRTMHPEAARTVDEFAPFSPEYADAPAPDERPRDGRTRPLVPPRLIIAGLALVIVVQAIVWSPFFTRAISDPPPRDPGAEVSLLAAAPPAGSVSTPVPQTPARRVPGESALPAVATTGAADIAPVPTTGRLIVRTTPEGATITVDGRRRGTSPLTLDRLAPGSHQVQVTHGGTSVDQTVSIDAGGSTALVIPMSQAGWVDLRSAVDVQVFEAGRLLGSSADGPINLPGGLHSLELKNEALEFQGAMRVDVVAGQILRVRPPIPDGLLQVNALPWAHVSVDGVAVGDTPLGNLRVPLGTHQIRFEHPDFGTQVRNVVVAARTPARVSVSLR
jgi:hypothetical protein